MRDIDKEKEQFIKEFEDARKRIAELEISERILRSTERSLSRSDKRYRLVSEHTADVIWTMDVLSPDQITYISPSVPRLLGYTVPEAMLKTMDEIFTPESVQTVMKTFLEAVPGGDITKVNPDESRTLELTMKHKDITQCII